MDTDPNSIQNELHTWRTHNFPDADATQQLLGVTEEVGELSHAHLKMIQAIRGTPAQHRHNKEDAVGDIVIYLMGYCSYEGMDFDHIMRKTLETVMKRDWVRFPHDGLSR